MYIQVYTWTSFVGAVLWLSCILWTQIALEKELGTCIPTVLQVNIKMILLNAVRIWWNYNNRVLRIPTMYISDDSAYILVYTNIYINIPWTIAYLWIKAMKTFCWHIKRITACTHNPSEKLWLPPWLHTAKGCQFTSDHVVLQDSVELGRSPSSAWLRSLICFIWKSQLLLHVLPNPLSQLCRQPAQGRVCCTVNILQPPGWKSPIWQSQ